MIQPDSYAGNPVRSLQTMLRTIAQLVPQQETVIPDGFYGPRTAKAVRCFQQRNGLPVTGIADGETWQHIADAYTAALADTRPAEPIRVNLAAGQVLRRGEENHKLFLVQTMLLTMSCLAEEIPAPEHTGILDEKTCSSLLAFQLKAGLRPTGEVDKQTWKTLVLQFACASDELSRRAGE